jgi:hypothetical protein
MIGGAQESLTSVLYHLNQKSKYGKLEIARSTCAFVQKNFNFFAGKVGDLDAKIEK